MGGQQVNAGSLSDCQAACEKSEDCEGVDFDRESNGCFLHQTKAGLVYIKGIEHYDYNCQSQYEEMQIS